MCHYLSLSLSDVWYLPINSTTPEQLVQYVQCQPEISGYDVCRIDCIQFNSTYQACTKISDPVTDEMFKENLYIEHIIRHIVPILFGVIVLLGLVGNVLVIAVVWSNKQMQNTTNVLIVSLAFADLLFIIFCVPFTAAGYAKTQWPFGHIWCKIVNYLIYVCAYASVWTLVLMSFDRYLAVVHPIASIRIRNRRNTYCLLVIVWSVIICGNVPILVQYNIQEYVFVIQDRSACINTEGSQTNLIFYSFFFSFGYLIPLALICILYGFLLKRLLYGVVPGGSQRAESIRSKKRVTRMVIIVVVIFAVCWLPIQLVLLIQSAIRDFNPSISTFAISVSANCLAYMNSCVNPILYAFLSENFRRSFIRLLCCSPEPFSKFEYERTNVHGREKDTKESLLNNGSKSNGEAKDKNSNSASTIQMKTINNTHDEAEDNKE